LNTFAPESNRPDPDALLSSIQREDTARKRGHLKVFFGMCPGVGKTYSMLEAAQRELQAGHDVVIGYVETHGRRETHSLVAGLPEISRLELNYRGVALAELNLDAVLARRPEIILVDELAHTNAPGSRHPKRWQDVQELLDAGIDVYTTLNVQHVESRADTVRQITRIEIRETVPDSVLDGAVIELIDLPPAELLQRLQEGKVYVPERAAAAAENFFQEASLTALREISLRLVAEHVGLDTRELRKKKSDTGTWKTSVRLMVALSASPLSASLIRWTRRLADSLQATWLAVYVETPTPLAEAGQSRLAANLDLARQLGAEVVTTTDDNVVNGLLRVARENNITQVIFGKTGRSGWFKACASRRVLQRLVESSGDIDVLVVRADKAGSGATAVKDPFRITHGRQYLAALATSAVVTILGWGTQGWIGYQAVALIYLAAVILLAMLVGRGPILLAATLTALCWDFLFVPPTFTFHISGFHDTIMFGMYFLVALVIGQLTAQRHLQQAAEREREQRTTALYRLTRELAGASDYPELLSAAMREVGGAFDAEVALMLPNPESNQQLVRYFAGLWVLDEKEESVATWAFRHNQPAGRFTDTLPHAAGLHLPLSVGAEASGVLALRFRSHQVLKLQQRNLLDSFVRQIALVIDRQRLRDAEINARLISKSEQLSRTLLNSVSHELRTPISAIRSAASALASAGPLTGAQRDLTGEIETASIRLNQVVQNLLGAARLQSGHLSPRLDWCDITELIHLSVRNLEPELDGRLVTLTVPKNLPLVRADFVLLEQALHNLIVNAAIHTPAKTPVELSARIESGDLILTVADRGSGLPGNELEKVFDLFHRGPEAKPGGTGLGLSIVKGFIEAQGGRVRAVNRPGGGAEFSIYLPIPSPPEAPSETT
jgi:two-component system sensor histidine kinase KdpD